MQSTMGCPQVSQRTAPAQCRCMPPRVQRRRRAAVGVECLQNPRGQPAVNAAAALPVAPPQVHHTAPATTSGRLVEHSGFASDVLGLGQAVVDLQSSVPVALLDQFNVARGGRRVITVEERTSVLATLDELGAPSQVSAGGSLANTLVGVARLARAADKELRVSLGGSLGTDMLGQYFNSQMRQAGVRCILDTHHHHHGHHHHQQQQQQQPDASAVLSSSRASSSSGSAAAAAAEPAAEPSAGGHTGTVMVLTTPDAQRSFLSFFTSESLALSERLRAAVRDSRLVVIEGYLLEMPGAESYIGHVLDAARAGGAQVALTAGDPGVVARHRDTILRVLARPGGGVDMLFCNEDEAAELVGREQLAAAAAAAAVASEEGLEKQEEDEEEEEGAAEGRRAALALAALVPMVVVTAGSRGSYVSAMGQLHAVPPYWLPQGPVDTCGAGDNYMAGFLYGILAGYDAKTAGELGSRVASAVIGRLGPHLLDDDAEELVASLPEHMGPLRVRLAGQAGQLDLGAGGFPGV